MDGSRQQPIAANVYLKDGRIAEISTSDKPAHRIVDAANRVVSPGFVDIHSHSGASYLTVPTHQGKLVGGVTFPVSDFASYASHIEQSGVSINLGGLIGHGTLRRCIAGWEMRQLTPSETETMCALLDQ